VPHSAVLAIAAIALNRGLNVVLGPNEAGKSTLVNALFAALFFAA